MSSINGAPLTQPPDPSRSGVESVPVSFRKYGCGQGLMSGAFAELKRGRPGSKIEIGLDNWCQPAKRCVWSLFIIIDPPVFDDLSGLSKIAEDVFVEAFIPQSAIEAFYKCVFHGLAGCDVLKTAPMLGATRVAF